MRTVGIHEAKTNLSSLVREVEDGAEVVVTRGGRPVARLVPVRASEDGLTPGQRGWGMFKGQMHLADDFKSDSDELADLFGIPRLPGEAAN